MIYTIFVMLLLVCCVQSESEICYQLENTETKAYTYYICTGTSTRDFDASQEFCKRIDTFNGQGAHLVTFPNEQEFSFLISKLSAEEEDNFRFYPGIYQKSTADRYNPETGSFYWVTDDDTQIDINSESYWRPFSRWIESFDSMPLQEQQTGNFLMDKDGQIYPVVQLGGSLSADIDDPSIICMSKGIAPKHVASTSDKTHRDNETIIELWMIIVIVAGGVFLLILMGVCIGCCINKRRGKFLKVPTEEKLPASPTEHPQV